MARNTHRVCSYAFIMLISLTAAPPTGVGQESDSQEPPLRFRVRIADKTLSLSEGEMQSLEGKFDNPQVRITIEPTRRFAKQGVEFDYPRAFVFEADTADAHFKNWTLSGNDLRIMLFVFDNPISAAEQAESIVAEFGEGVAEITDRDLKLQLGTRTCRGVALTAAVAGTRMRMEVYELPQRGNASRLLLLQDTLNEQDQGTAEGAAARKLLSTSFKITPP